jgi:hypothetical protein
MDSSNESTIHHLFFLLLRAVARGLGVQKGLEEFYCILLWKTWRGRE